MPNKSRSSVKSNGSGSKRQPKPPVDEYEDEEDDFSVASDGDESSSAASFQSPVESDEDEEDHDAEADEYSHVSSTDNVISPVFPSQSPKRRRLPAADASSPKRKGRDAALEEAVPRTQESNPSLPSNDGSYQMPMQLTQMPLMTQPPRPQSPHLPYEKAKTGQPPRSQMSQYTKSTLSTPPDLPERPRKVSLSPRPSLAPPDEIIVEARETAMEGLLQMGNLQAPQSPKKTPRSPSKSKTPRASNVRNVHSPSRAGTKVDALSVASEKRVPSLPASKREKSPKKPVLPPERKQASTAQSQQNSAHKAPAPARAPASDDEIKIVGTKRKAASPPPTEAKKGSSVVSNSSSKKGNKKTGSKKHKGSDVAPAPDRPPSLPSSIKGKKAAATTAATSSPAVAKDSAVASKTPPLEPKTKAKTKAPAKKAKKKKMSFQDQVLHKLFLTCRPFSSRDLANEVKSAEAPVSNCLLSLIDKKWVIKKEFTTKPGRPPKVLFWVNQDGAITAKLKEALQMTSDEEIQGSRHELKALIDRKASLAKELQVVLSTPSNDDLARQIREKEAELAKATARRTEMIQRIERTGEKVSLPIRIPDPPSPKKAPRRGVKSAFVPRTKQQKLKVKINAVRKEWKDRKDKCMKFVDDMADGMEKSVKDVVTKVLELETDEDASAKMPARHELG